MNKMSVSARSICILITISSVLTKNSVASNFSILTTLWGKASQSNVLFLPVGFHFDEHQSRYNNQQWFISGSFHGFIGGTFINSFNDRVFFVGLERQVYQKERIDIFYLIGVMQGYGKRLQGHNCVTQILGHDPGPIISLGAGYAITQHIHLNMAYYGLGVLGGGSYVFS